MTKKNIQKKQVALKVTNKAKGTSSNAQPKKTNKNQKRLASDDDESISDETAEKSLKKTKKGIEEDEFQVEEEEVEVISGNEDGSGAEDEAGHNKVSIWFRLIIITYHAIGSKQP